MQVFTAAVLLFSSLPCCLPQASKSQLYHKVEADLFRFGKPPACTAVSAGVEVAASKVECAVFCSSQTSCHSFYVGGSCQLLTSACVPNKVAERALMMVRPVDASAGHLWRYNGHMYRLTPNTGRWEAMRSACAQFGMYLWFPNDLAEFKFVRNNIFAKLGVQDKYKTARGDVKMWSGMYNPAGSTCQLEDNTACPFVLWRDREPSLDEEKCIAIKPINVADLDSFKMNDLYCFELFFGLCEGKYP